VKEQRTAAIISIIPFCAFLFLFFTL